MYCQNCGTENQADSKFCVTCGIALNSSLASDYSMKETVILDSEETTLLQEDNVSYNNQQNDFGNQTVQSTYNQFVQSENSYNQIISKEEFFTKLLSKNSKSWIKALWIICFITVVLCAVTIITGNIFAVGTLITMITAGMASGLFPLICGVMATKTLKKADKAYEQYKTTGVYPTEQI